MAMATNILSLIDVEISRLQAARDLLASTSRLDVAKDEPDNKRRKKHNLTPEGRKRLQDAVKRRWAKHRALQK